MSAMTPQRRPRALSKDGSVHITDEFYNTLISSVGAVLALIGVALLLYGSLGPVHARHLIGFSVYGAALINLFLASALHHGIHGTEKTEHFFRQWDYYAIFLMIAGSFTPICLLVLPDIRLGGIILGLVWFLAIFGILLKAAFPALPKWISTVLYVGMGWSGLAIARPIYQRLPELLIAMLVGGIFFTVGSGIFFLEKPNPVPGRFGFHEIWHLFVLAGSASHFYAMYAYLLPR